MLRLTLSIAAALFTFDFGFAVTAVATPLGDRLGFEPDAKIVIIHADDLGSIESANRAGADDLAYGVVSSASVMMACPAVRGAISYAHSHPHSDLGVHLTLTSEWKNYRWGPTLLPGLVRSLVDRQRGLQPSLFSLFFRGSTNDVRAEMESQIQRAIASGLNPTHIDTHMGSAYLHPDWFYAYLNLGRKYHLPPMAPRWSDDLKHHYGWIAGTAMSFVVPDIMKKAEDAGYLLLDSLIDQPFPKSNSYEARKAAYAEMIRTLKPGVTQIILHPAYNDSEFARKILSSNPEQILRDWEARMFQDPDFKSLLRERHVHLIGWREIQKAYDWSTVKEIQ